MIAELLNSALETTVDRIGTEHRQLSGQAKDMGSAAVFASLKNFSSWYGSASRQAAFHSAVDKYAANRNNRASCCTVAE